LPIGILPSSLGVVSATASFISIRFFVYFSHLSVFNTQYVIKQTHTLFKQKKKKENNKINEEIKRKIIDIFF
jgi:hypothetical protein